MNIWMAFNGYDWSVETLGERGSLAYIGPDWAAAASSPARLFKFTTAEGGIRVPLVVSGPGVAAARKHAAPAFVTDMAPTILDLVGVTAPPEDGVVPITGASLRPVLEGRAERTHGLDRPVGVEVAGNAALFKGDHKIVRNAPPHGDGGWHLYDVANDPGETRDLSTTEPARFAAMVDDYAAYAKTMGVLDMPPGYDVQSQVERNALARQIEFYWWVPTLVVLLLGGLGLGIWRRRAAR
jgi:arylsulfatase/uncharacterized sulfatase